MFAMSCKATAQRSRRSRACCAKRQWRVMRALDVYDRAASELAQIITAAARGVFDPSDPVPVGYVGGVFEGAGEFLLGPLRRLLPNGFELVEPAYGPTAGPCLLLARRLSE